MNEHGITLFDANDVLPVGFAGTPWEIIYNALRDVLKNNFSDESGAFLYAAAALHYIAKGEYDKITDPAVLDGLAAAVNAPFWVENSPQTERAAAVLNLWLVWKPTKANLRALAIASGMRNFDSHEQYTLTEWGYYARSFLFDLGDGALDSFFAVGDTDEAKYASICVALYRFIARLGYSVPRLAIGPGLVINYSAPDAQPSGAKYYLRADQSEIRLLLGYNWNLYNSDGSLVFRPDEYAVYTLQAVRDTFGKNTSISGGTHLLFLDSGQVRLDWEQSPATAYAVYADVDIDIPGKIRAWLSVDHSDVSIPPHTIPGAVLYDAVGNPLTGDGYELFAAYNSALARIDTESLALVGTNPVYLRSGVYVTLNQVWLISAAPSGIDGYFTAAGSAEISETTVGYNSGQWIYDASGNNAVYDTSKIYRIVAVFDLAGNQMPIGADDNLHELIGWVIWESHVSPVTGQPYDAYRMLYEEIEPDGLVAYLSSSGVSGSGNEQCGFNSYQNLYTASGSLAQYTPGATYRILGVYDKNHNKIEASDQDFLYDNGNILWYSNVLPGTGQPYEAHHLIYEEVTP